MVTKKLKIISQKFLKIKTIIISKRNNQLFSGKFGSANLGL
jgi:hypothetical protein